MSLAEFFTPVAAAPDAVFYHSQFGREVQAYRDGFPDLADPETKPHIALIGVCEGRAAVNNGGTERAPDAVRRHLYDLYLGDYAVRIADLGNIPAGKTVRDTYAALKTVVEELVKQDVLPIIIGGGQDLTYAQYMAYERLEQRVEVAVIDAKFDLDQDEGEPAEPTSATFLNHIILHEPDYLFNLSNLAYQTYLTGKNSVNMYDKLFFSTMRLGMMAGKTDQAEPLIRAADMVSFDIGAVRASEAPGNANAGPNGLYGDEACQLARYAGMSDKCSSIGFYEFNPAFDPMGHTAALVAQMVWCFVDGFYGRKHDAPLVPKSDYILYRTTMEDGDHELVFAKSKKSDRWWMQVPYLGPKSVNGHYHWMPCRYEDYQQAVSGDLPDLWWRACQKLQ